MAHEILHSYKLKSGITVVAMALDPPFSGTLRKFPYAIAIRGKRGTEDMIHVHRFEEKEWDKFVSEYAYDIKNQRVLYLGPTYDI